MTATVGTACASARPRKRVLSAARVAMPPTATSTAITARTMPAMRNLRRDTAGVAESGDMKFSNCGGRAGRGLAAVVRVHDAEDDRHEHERCDRGEQQAADHGTAERG